MPAQDIVMPTQYKYSSHIRSVGKIYPLGHKLTKTLLPPNVFTLQLTGLPTPNSQVHQLASSTTHQLTNSTTHQLTNSKPHQFINPSTHKLKTPLTYQLKNSLIHQPTKLKSFTFILQQRSIFHSILAKIQVKKQAKSHYFQPFMSFALSIFRLRTCILHHFTFLVWPKARNLSRPKTHFLTQKTNFLTTILPFQPCVSWFYKTIFIPLRRIFILFGSHLAAKNTAFSTILPCVLHQNALHLAPKRVVFCTKTHHIQRGIARKLVQRTVFINKNSFCRMRIPTPFCIKTNLHENRFFAARRTLGDQKWH